MNPRLQQIILSKPWNKKLVKKLNKGFGDIDYVEHTQVTQKLIAVSPDWHFDINEYIKDTVEDMNGIQRTFITGVQVTIQMKIDGQYLSRSEVGMCDKPFFHSDPSKVYNNGQRAKECVSDAIKRCAMRFGVGIELYDTDAWISEWLYKENIESQEHADYLQDLQNDEQQASDQELLDELNNSDENKNIYKIMEEIETKVMEEE
tara:strand:+ start:1855 stop:2466 length:612 start_codon:yes stop_codon:yes gene_type:complete